MQYTQQVSRSKPQLIEDAKMWEKYTHHIIRSKYDLMTIDEEEEPLYTYLVKAQKLHDLYEEYHSSNDPTQEQELLESLVDADSDDREQQIRQLTFPFDQVAEGYFLAYFLEVIGDLQKGIYSQRLKKDVSYRIQYVKNLEFLLNVIHNDFKLDLMKHGVEAEALAKNNYEAVNNMFWLLFSKLKLDRVLHNGARGEEGLLQWACDCVSFYPSVDMSDMQFEDGFSDGTAFCYIFHFYNAESIELHRVIKEQSDENLKQAFEAGWKYCNIPHIIQNHNINRRSAILYLHMMYEALHTKDRSTFDTNQISRIIRRKLEFEKLKNFYSDAARTLLDDLRGMEQDIQDIRPNQYLPQVRIDDLLNQFLNDYKADKANFLGDFLKIHMHHFHMECFLKAENGFQPFDPPKQLNIRHLYEIYDSLTPMEQRYMSTFHNIVSVHNVVSDALEDYTHTMDAVKAFTEDVTDKIVNLELGTELESYQHVHSQVGDILTDIGQHRALLRIIRQVDAFLKSHQIAQKPLIEDIETMWDATHRQTSELLAKVEREMSNQIDAEVLKLEYSFMTDAMALSIANALLSLQAPYVSPKIMRKLFFAVDNFVVEKTKRLQEFTDAEQKLVVLGQDIEITREHLSSFLEDLLELKKIKEKDVQELMHSHELRERIESAANQLSSYMLDFANFLEKASQRAVGQKYEPEEHISRHIDTFKSFEKEKGHFSNLLKSFLDLYSQYAAENRFVDIKFSDQSIQARWNRLFEAAEAQKEWLYQRLEKHEQIPTLRLTQQAETQKMLQFLNHQKRDPSMSATLPSDRRISSENTLRLHEENIVTKCAEMRQIVSRHVTITAPGLISEQVRQTTVGTFSTIAELFSHYVSNVLDKWNQYTLNVASIFEINKQRVSRLQRQLTQSIQNSSMRIPSLKAVEEVLQEAKVYSHEYIILDQIEFIDEIISKTDPSDSRERTQQIEILQNQWKKLWDLIRGQVRKLVEGEGNIISPDLDFLNEKFKRNLEKLRAKASSLDQEYKHDNKNLAKILKTISEIQADLHHAKIFYDLFVEQIEALDHQEQSKYNISGFQALQNWITQIRKEIEKDVLTAFQHEENKRRYKKIASSFLETVHILLDNLTSSEIVVNKNQIIKIENLCVETERSVMKLQQDLKILAELADAMEGHRDRPDYGEYTADYLSHCVELVLELLSRVRNDTSISKDKLTFFMQVRDWMDSQINTIMNWIRRTEHAISAVEKIASPDDVLLTRRELQHHLQESSFVQQSMGDIARKLSQVPDEACEEKLLNVRDAWDVLFPKLKRTIQSVDELEESFTKRRTFITQVEMDNMRLCTFIDILKTKNIDRPSNFIGRVTVNLLESYLGDCSVLNTYIQQLPDLTKVQFNPLESHTFLEPIDREIERLCQEYRQNRLHFETLLSETTHKLESYLKSERQLHELHSDYQRLTQPLLTTIIGVESKYDPTSLEDMQAIAQSNILHDLSPSYEAVKKIHNNCANKVIESVPFDILQSKWKRLCRVARSSDMRAGISIDHQKRQQELKRLILETARQVSMWVDDALNTLQMTSSIPVNSAQHVQQAQAILHEIRLLHEEEEGTQYGKLIQILNLHTELVLFGGNSTNSSQDTIDIENIIKNIERKWLLWLRDSKTIMDKLNHLIEELMISDYQKKHFHNMSVGIVEWIDLVTRELSQITPQAVQDLTQLHIQMYHIAHWMRQKQSKLEMIAELQEVCDTMRVPDNELMMNMKEIRARWAHLERIAAEKESLLTQLGEKFDQVRTEDTQILHTQEEMIRWISFERDHLIHALKQETSLMIQEALDQTRIRVKAEASPLLEYLRKQRKFAHKQLLESHWSTFMFLFNRTKKRCDELQEKEQRRKVKLETFQSKLEVHYESLSQLLEAVQRIVQYSDKATVQEMESALNDMIEVYASMEHIVSDFVSLLTSVDKDDDVLVDHQITKSFESFCIDCFTRFEELFQQYSADYEAKMKSDGISSAYFSLYNALSDWSSQQKERYELQQTSTDVDSRQQAELLTCIASQYQFFKDYFSQRQQITLMYRQMSDIWATLSSMGIVLEMELPTPVDLKNLIESLDETMGNALSRSDDLVSQFDYVLSLRQQFIETACNLSEFSQDALQQLTEYPVISLQSFHHVREQVESYKKRDRNTVSVLSFLEELIQTILDECILLPKDWDPQLKEIVTTLRSTRNMFETALTSKEKFLLKCEPLLNEMTSANGIIRDMRNALLAYTSQIKPHLEEFVENQAISRAERLNQLGKFVSAHNSKSKYLSKLLSVCSKVKHLNWSAPDDDFSLASVWNEVYPVWTGITTKLDECVQDASIVGEGIPPMTKTSDVQLFLEILFLNIWISDSCLDLQSLLDHDLRREDISDILFDINIFSREMEENQVVLKRVVGVDPDSVEIQNLKHAWSQLQELFSRAIEKLTDHVMVKFHFEHDRERVLSIHKSLAEFIGNETHLSNPSLLNQEYRFYYELMIPEHYENNVTLRNLFTSREIRALQEDFENMKKPFLQYMSTEDNHAQEIENIRTLITDIVTNLLQYVVLFSQRDLYLEEDLEELIKQLQQCEKSCDNITSSALVTLTHFVETLDEEYQSIHVSLLDFVQNLVQMIASHVGFIQSEVKVLFNQRASLEHIKKKYHQKSASILDRLGEFEELIDKYQDEEDISGAINIISRSSNPNSMFQPVSKIAARYLEKLRMSPDDMQKQFDILYTLKYEVESLGVIFSDLCLIHSDKLLSERIATDFQLADDNNTESLENISHRWNAVVSSVNTQIDNLPVTDLEKSSRFLEIDFQELTRWFDDALQFVRTCEEGKNNNQFHDLQWTLLGTKMFKIRRDNMEDRYNRYISTLLPGDESEVRLNTLNDKKDLLEERMNALPSESTIQQKINKALEFEHQQLEYAQHIEEIQKWQEEFDHDLDQFAELINKIRTSATSMGELENKLSNIEKCKILLPIYSERFEEIRPMVDQAEVNYMSIKEHEFFDELFFTELEPEAVVGHRAEQKQQLKQFAETVQVIEREVQDKMKQGMDFILRYNNLAKWGEQSLALFYNNITLDSSSMIDHARLRAREWSIEYHDERQEDYENVLQTMSMQNNALVFFIAYSIKYFSVLSVDDFKKMWNKMLVAHKNRESQLEKLREHQEEVGQKYRLPAEIVDPIYSTFMHFAHHNTKSSSIGMLHEYLMGRFLITVGLNLLDDFERTKEVERALTYSGSGDQKSLTFDEMMKYLSENHLNTAFKASDLIVMFRRIERARGTLTWERLVSVIGAALNQEQIQLLYTLIRFSGTGIDYERLAEDMFG